MGPDRQLRLGRRYEVRAEPPPKNRKLPRPLPSAGRKGP